MNCYIRKDLDAWKKPAEITLIIDAHVVTHWYEVESFEEAFASKCEELAKHPFNPEQARKKRIEAIKHHTQYLRCEFEKPNYLKAVNYQAGPQEISYQIIPPPAQIIQTALMRPCMHCMNNHAIPHHIQSEHKPPLNMQPP